MGNFTSVPSGPAMRVARVVMVAFMASACGVTTEVVVLNPAAPAYAPVSPDSVHVFASPNSVLLDYEAIATISAGASASGLIAPDEVDMLTALREAAGALGADAIILSVLLDQHPSGTGDGMLPASARGTAVRLLDGPGRAPSLDAAARPIEGVATIALSPVVRGEGLFVRDTIMSLFEQDVRATLLAHGFNTVSRAAYDSLRLAHILDAGGLFDPVTGQRYDDRVMLVEQWTRQTLIDEYGVDGFFHQEISNAPAYDSTPEAEWDETRQRMIVPEDAAPERKRETIALDGSVCPAGNGERCVGVLRALSFSVRLENSFGAMLYTGRGSIEFWELQDNAGEPYLLPPPHRSDRAESNREAVALGLAELVRGSN